MMVPYKKTQKVSESVKLPTSTMISLSCISICSACSARLWSQCAGAIFGLGKIWNHKYVQQITITLQYSSITTTLGPKGVWFTEKFGILKARVNNVQRFFVILQKI